MHLLFTDSTQPPTRNYSATTPTACRMRIRDSNFSRLFGTCFVRWKQWIAGSQPIRVWIPNSDFSVLCGKSKYLLFVKFDFSCSCGKSKYLSFAKFDFSWKNCRQCMSTFLKLICWCIFCSLTPPNLLWCSLVQELALQLIIFVMAACLHGTPFLQCLVFCSVRVAKFFFFFVVATVNKKLDGILDFPQKLNQLEFANDDESRLDIFCRI